MNKIKLIPCMFFAAMVGACAGNYEAPVADRTSVADRSPPEVAPSTLGRSPSRITEAGSAAPRAQPSIESSRPGETRSRTANQARTTSTSQSTTSAPATTSSGVGTATAVAVAPLTGGITRSAIGSSPLSSAPSPVTAAASSTDNASHHTVARGETLYSIAWMYNADYRRIAVANNLSAPYTIYPGQRLTLSQGGVSDSDVSALPDIPAAPAGQLSAASSGQRPQAAMDSRRTGSVASRQVEGISWQWPTDGRIVRRFASADSSRGIDISANRGDPVYAVADGDVVYAGRGIQGAGNLIILRHSARHLSAYMHNSMMLVTEGATIRAGDKIGEVGTDPSGSELLHFEIRVDGQPVDPLRYLPAQ